MYLNDTNEDWLNRYPSSTEAGRDIRMAAVVYYEPPREKYRGCGAALFVAPKSTKYICS